MKIINSFTKHLVEMDGFVPCNWAIELRLKLRIDLLWKLRSGLFAVQMHFYYGLSIGKFVIN